MTTKAPAQIATTTTTATTAANPEPAITDKTAATRATTTPNATSSARRILRSLTETRTQLSTGDAKASWLAVTIIGLPWHTTTVFKEKRGTDQGKRRDDAEPTRAAVVVDSRIAELGQGIGEEPAVQARDDRRRMTARLRKDSELGDKQRLERAVARVAQPRANGEPVHHLETGEKDERDRPDDRPRG